jgi:hypothetical protein
MRELIDNEELPFTTEEIYQAASTFLAEDVARSMASHFADLGPDAIRAREERRAGWRAAGIANAATRPLHFWEYPPALLPALEKLSDDAARRVEELRRRLGEPR